MNFYLKLYISIALVSLSIGSSDVFAQAKTNDLVIKIYNDNDKLMYRKFSSGEIKWINKHNFNTSNYDWKNNDINLHLIKAKNSRVRSHFALGLGVTSQFLGALALIGSGMSESSEGQQEYEQTSITLFISSILFVSTSIAFNINGKNQINKASLLRSSSIK